ncbi:NUDIX hydrolase [Patescibacteria group bacterium]|nr:NUDIX hydrolase [Patescibacteria group bacterium]MBU1886031.1 NUDIX hydrolase [Patescibacteria group bacterium]
MKKQLITACAFLYQNRKLFTAKRAETKKFLPGKYELPGGHIEYGESLEEGLAREFEEEFGAEIKVGKPIHAFTYINSIKESHSVEIVFLATFKDRAVITLNPTDHSKSLWISEDEIDQYFDRNDNEYKAIEVGFKEIK